MFDVLVYLFENYYEANIHPDLDTLEQELTAAGFEEADISSAFDWYRTLEEMTLHSAEHLTEPGVIRIYAEQENQKIHLDGLGFMLFLEQAGVIDAAQRELVVDRAMALQDREVSLDQIKWIMLMTLWKQNKASDYLFIEDVVLGDIQSTLH